MLTVLGPALLLQSFPDYSISTAMAVASPPPMHNEATPFFSLRAFSAWISVTIKRALTNVAYDAQITQTKTNRWGTVELDERD